MKTVRRVMKWTVGLSCLALLTAATIVALLAWRRPADYKPVVLTDQQQQQAKVQMFGRLQTFLDSAAAIGSVGPDGRRTALSLDSHGQQGLVSLGADGQSFTMEVSQTEASEWIASLPPAVVMELNRIGLRDPAVGIARDRLTFYVFSDRQKGVIGLDFGFEFLDDSMMRLELQDVRMGELKLPRQVYEDIVARLDERIQTQIETASRGQPEGEGEIAGVSVNQVRSGAASLLASLHGEPVSTDLREMGIGHVRIASIVLEPEKLTINVESTLEEGEALPALPGAAGAEAPAETGGDMDFDLD